MRLRFFTVPVCDPSAAQDEVNRFLASHRVLSVDRELVSDGAGSVWALCVAYVDGEKQPVLAAAGRKGRVDYRELLPESEFAVFARLRSLRKTLAEKEGVPAYALFTNEQLAAMVTGRVTTAAALEAIDGVGPARLEKYGEAFLAILKGAIPVLDSPGGPAGGGGAKA